MAMKSRIISPHMRDTLEYAEAIKLLIDRRIVQQHLERINEGIRLVRRISPCAVEQARRDFIQHDEEDGLNPAACQMKAEF